MDWRLKALIQNAISALPPRVSYSAYYAIQRRFGGLRCANPLPAIQAAADIAATIIKHGQRIEGSTVLEVGTGRTLNLPITMWLLGAQRVMTVDLNPYLKFELVAEDLQFLQTHRSEWIDILRPLGLDMRRLHRLLEFDSQTHYLPELMAICQIDYLAPVNAADLPLADGSMKFHVSSNVYEHIPRSSLAGILQEAFRVVPADGLCVYRIDHSDHFAHSDPKLSPVNFLQFSDAKWSRLSGNKYMFMNRLRVDDFESLFEQSNIEVISVQAAVDEKALADLKDGSVRLDPKFTGKPLETLATLRSTVVGRPRSKRLQTA